MHNAFRCVFIISCLIRVPYAGSSEFEALDPLGGTIERTSASLEEVPARLDLRFEGYNLFLSGEHDPALPFELYMGRDLSAPKWVLVHEFVGSGGIATATGATMRNAPEFGDGYHFAVAGSGADRDQDGLSDGFERLMLATLPSDAEVLSLRTNPELNDTDGDGTLDGDEDFDGDGLSNREEYKNRYCGFFQSSSPLHPDTDGDGVSDGPLVPEGSSLLPGPDMFPRHAAAWRDSDCDGLPDERLPSRYGLPGDPPAEDTNANGVVDPGETDPNNADSDEDGRGDGDERREGTDPLRPDNTAVRFLVFNVNRFAGETL